MTAVESGGWPADALPRVPRDLLGRPRLHRVLDEWAPVTLVTGPRGSGKTTLIADWLGRQSPATVHGVWITVRPELASPADFAAHLTGELAHRRVGWPRAQHEPAAGLLGFDKAMGSLGANLQVVLVLDSSDHLRDPQLWTELVQLAQRHHALHIVACSQARTPAATIAAGSVDVRTISPDDLVLDATEIEQLAARMGVLLHQEHARDLLDAVGGWIAIVRIALSASGGFAAGPTEIERYVRALAQLDDVTKEVTDELLRLAFTDPLEPALARHLAIVNGHDPDRTLAHLESSPLVARRPADDGSVQLTLPTVVRDVLQAMFTEHEPAAVRDLHRQLGSWYAQRGATAAAAAFRHAVEGRDLDLASSVAAEFGLTVGFDHPGVFVKPLQTLSAAELDHHPALRIARDVGARALAIGDDDGLIGSIRAYSEHCARVIAGGWNAVSALDPADLLPIGTGHIIGLRTAGRVEEAASFGDRVAALLATRIPDGAGLQSAQGWFHLQRGLTLTILGRHDPAAHCYESSWRHASESGARQISANAAANMALTQALAGRPDSARRWLDRFHSHVGDHWSTYLVGLGASLADGLLALDAHDMRGAQAAIDRIGDDGTAELELWPYIAHLRAQCALLHADAPTALASFDAAVAAHRHRLLDYENAGPLVSRARLDLLVAAGYAERAVAAAPPAYTRDPVLMAPAARISLLTGNAIGARRIVATCLDSEPLTPRQRLELLLIDASAAARLGDDDSARAVAVRAHDIATSAGIQTAFSTISARDRGSLAALGVEVGAPRPGWASAYPDELTVVLLTRSEQALLRALEITDSRQQIAAQLFVSHNTIKSQLSRLYRKLNARTRDEALLKAHQLGLV